MFISRQVLRMHSGDHEESFVEELTDPGVVGALAVKLPLPPGFMTSLYKNDARFLSAYMTEYPGYYNTGDIGYIDDDGYVFVTSRAEDEIKISGHRISTGAMEEVSAHFNLRLSSRSTPFLLFSTFLHLRLFLSILMCVR